MVLVDSSVFVDFFANRQTVQTAAMKSLLSRGEVCICGLVLTEVLQGIRNDRQYRLIKALLADFPLLGTDTGSFLLAAEIYRSLRRAGVTIRKTNNCIIAAVAVENSVPLLQSDRDFDLIASGTKLKIFDGTGTHTDGA